MRRVVVTVEPIRYVADCDRIIALFAARGGHLDRLQAYELWGTVSAARADAGWLSIPEDEGEFWELCDGYWEWS